MLLICEQKKDPHGPLERLTGTSQIKHETGVEHVTFASVVKSEDVSSRYNSSNDVPLRHFSVVPQRYVSDGSHGKVSGALAPEPARGSLPCLNRNNSTEVSRKLTPYGKKTAFALTANIARLADLYGIERLAFVTLGFADPEPCDLRSNPNFDAKEAGRRLNSLQTHVLRELFSEMIVIPERGGTSGRLHYHLLAVVSGDIRTGVDFDGFQRGDFSTAPKELRRIWAVCRSKLTAYGFGGWHQVFPVKSTAEGISKYVGKYISKQFAGKRPEDKGLRLVRYTKGTNHHRVTFSWNSSRAKLWRWQVGEFARRNGCANMDELSANFPNWTHWHKDEIMAIEPPGKVISTIHAGDGEPPEFVTLWDVWHGDRVALALVVAQHAGLTQAEAFTALYQAPLADSPGGFCVLTVGGVVMHESAEFIEHRERVARLYNDLLARDLENERQREIRQDEDGETVDRTTVWADGRIERGPESGREGWRSAFHAVAG